MGCTYNIYAEGTFSSVPLGGLSLVGTHVVITLGPAQPAGVYQVVADATTVSNDVLVKGAYYSTSAVRAGIATPDTQYAVGEWGVLSALVFDGSTPVTGATVTARVSTPQILNAQATLGNYSLVQQTDLDSETTEYEYRVTLSNSGAALSAVTAELVDSDPAIQVVMGMVFFGDVPENGSVVSGTTFTVRAAQGQTLSPSSFQWEIKSPGVPVDVVLTDSGSFDETSGDGLYSAGYAPGAPGEYLVTMKAAGTSLSGLPFSRSGATTFQVLAPLAHITSFQEALTDNGNGGTTGMTLTANVDVQTAGNYQLSLRLVASNENVVDVGSQVTLASGSQQMAGS
jgi:hypothetical protein